MWNKSNSKKIQPDDIESYHLEFKDGVYHILNQKNHIVGFIGKKALNQLIKYFKEKSCSI